ncbi:MAG: hypothetical protein HY749_10000 [Gammaproteobacteria bacterium]|nr:hypothetical protein [Gammaproteobacteria bacterium]MBI5617811.1 hypothetical protein [Gammaproteobacteria bacterium]
MAKPMLAALFAAELIVAPVKFAAAAPTPTVDASVNAYTAIGVGAIPQADWVPIAVTRHDGPGHAEAQDEGGSFIATRIGPGLQDAIFTSASAAGFASADPGVLRVYGSDHAIAQPAVLAPNVPFAPNSNTV